MSIHALVVPITVLLFALQPSIASAAEPESAPVSHWPLVAPNQGGELRLYHPHVESLKGDRITTRAAFSITAGDQAQPTFGVVWLSARVVTDRENRTVTLSDQVATKVHLPGATDQEETSISAAVTELVKGLEPILHLDRILAALSEAERDRQSAEDLSTIPPKIIVVEHRAMLLYVDGEPLSAPLAGSRFERIQNTPFLVARDPANGVCWLLYGGCWYRAPAITGPWAFADQVSNEVMALAPALQGIASDGAVAPIGTPVDIVVSLEPAELISSDGPPAYEPIQGTNLLAVTNSDSDLFLDITNQQHYLLLAGRWFRTGALASGAWEFVVPAALPQDFTRIPPDSKYGTVLAHVPGTSAAEEATLDAQVPQTAAVKRDATIAVTYDGEPQWQPIPNTSLAYAVNTPQAVIKAADDEYYCCSQGVWYRAPSPAGPWTVATRLPADIGRIPPDNPLYNVRYVSVYGTTPDYVYVGYTSGYLGGYVYDGCVVWGTGYDYHGWRGHRYFPRPVTWGFGMDYNPWTGHWGVGDHHVIGGQSGGFAVNNLQVGSAHSGWWGPAGYRPVIANRQPTDNHGNRIADQRHPETREPLNQTPSDNLYRRPENRERVQPTTISQVPARPAEPQRPTAPPPTREPERIVPGHDGEVFRQNGEGWQQWQRDGWKAMPVEAGHPSPTPPTANRPPAPPAANRSPAPPVRSEGPPQGVSEGHPAPPPARSEKPVQPPPTGESHPPSPPTHSEKPVPPPPSRTEQLEHQQKLDDRGIQRSQQFQQYRTDPPDALRRPAADAGSRPRQ
jgi:hypothetical protein